MSDRLSQLCFQCTECGDCCRRKGEVRFDDATLMAMAEHLELDINAFRVAKDVFYQDGHPEPWWFDIGENDACPLLVGDTCSVHPARPRQCRTYPFWPETTRNAQSWERERDHCPGIGLGEPWPRQEVVRRVELEDAAERLAKLSE